jgi:hypothetical protein
MIFQIWGKKVHALATGNNLTMRLIGHGQLGQGNCQRTIKCDTWRYWTRPKKEQSGPPTSGPPAWLKRSDATSVSYMYVWDVTCKTWLGTRGFGRCSLAVQEGVATEYSNYQWLIAVIHRVHSLELTIWYQSPQILDQFFPHPPTTELVNSLAIAPWILNPVPRSRCSTRCTRS